jgi:hypothetical protein
MKPLQCSGIDARYGPLFRYYYGQHYIGIFSPSLWDWTEGSL